MERREVEQGMKIYNPGVTQSTMMFLDNKRSKNNENYQTMYRDFNPENSYSELDDDRDVKIWIPISSRI